MSFCSWLVAKYFETWNWAKHPIHNDAVRYSYVAGLSSFNYWWQQTSTLTRHTKRSCLEVIVGKYCQTLRKKISTINTAIGDAIFPSFRVSRWVGPKRTKSALSRAFQRGDVVASVPSWRWRVSPCHDRCTAWHSARHHHKTRSPSCVAARTYQWLTVMSLSFHTRSVSITSHSWLPHRIQIIQYGLPLSFPRTETWSHKPDDSVVQKL